MEQSGVLPFDQVCYRIVIQLCGKMQQPHLAVRVWQAMKVTFKDLICLVFRLVFIIFGVFILSAAD